jgi:hypothetical protein
MSAPVPDPEDDVEVKVKRRRYNVQYDFQLEKQVILKARLEIASVISNSSTMEDSMWLKSSCDKIPSCDMKKGSTLMIPVDLQDENEITDDAWVTSSNWYFCHVEEMNLDVIAKVMILGTIIDMDEQQLPIEWSTTVALPAYVLSPKGRLKDMSDDLLVALTTASNQKGEIVATFGEVKKISMYGIPDLDGIPRPCSMKAEGIKRMLKVGGLKRLLGERFDRLIKDLSYSRQTFMATCQRYAESAESLPKNSIFKSFVKLPKLKGLPVYDDVNTLEMLLLGDYPLYDRSQISLKDFVSFKSENVKWGKSPTREGRAAFTDAFTNFQKVLVVYFGNDYNECCKDVLDILNEDEDILQEYNDSYIQVKMEMAISLFYHDIYKEKESLAYPTMLMTTPSQCAALLKQYLSNEIEKARNPSSTNTWERHPHSKFYSQEGTFNKVKFRKAIKPETPANKVNNSLCIWHSAGLLQVKNAKDQPVACRRAQCEWSHRNLSECTKKELLLKADSLGGFKAQYIRQIGTMEKILKDGRDTKK